MEQFGAEKRRLEEEHQRKNNWKRWGPYLAERQWATVREDYSADGNSWKYFPFQHAHLRSYRWGEDGILGITDRECRLCFALSFWNGEDPILKERIFGLIPGEGNHGEDVKECYFYIDSTPTHSYMKGVYKYPLSAFPYEQLVKKNQNRTLHDPEFELLDTGCFDNDNYIDAQVEYAKKTPDDILIRIHLTNQSRDEARMHCLPTLWFRNTWSWGGLNATEKPSLHLSQKGLIVGFHESLGKIYFAYTEEEEPRPLFTDNESNFEKLYQSPNTSAFVKDAFHDRVILNSETSTNPHNLGTKCAPWYQITLQSKETKTIQLRLTLEEKIVEPFGKEFDETFDLRKKEANEFYDELLNTPLSIEEKRVARQAFAGLLWTKQFYHYIVEEWLRGDPLQPKPPLKRWQGRNKDWTQLYCKDILSVPDKWEYPWFAAWDLAFHMIPFSQIDPQFAKQQLILFLREWYLHPNGQQPAYEYAFSDVNPPVHAWSVWRVYKMTAPRGERDIHFLESAFQKLLLNFTWWVNKKDLDGHNLFSGGFLGLDNIGVFDRSKMTALTSLQQADGTAWMAFYCLTMLSISLELASYNPVYEDMASKFFEHFILIADAINAFGGTGLWDVEDGFYYDALKHEDKECLVRTRSMVGLLPLIAVEILEDKRITPLKGFKKRMEWFLKNRTDLEEAISYCDVGTHGGHRILAIPSRQRLLRILGYLFDENEFLSPYGIRSLSKVHEKHPYTFKMGNLTEEVSYVPGTSNSYMFGGNSNWRGPIWFPINFLIIEALERYDHFYGEEFKVEYPTGSGNLFTLKQAAQDIAKRLTQIFLPDAEGKRPCFGTQTIFKEDPSWQELLLFHEYFHAETGKGLGAEHQTGWTALVAHLLLKKKR